jgi:hypothetical protein
MLLIYNPTDGEIFYVVKTADIPTFAHSTNTPLETAEIPDEDEDLQTLRAEVYQSQSRKDAEGKGRFYVDTQANPPELVEREDWQEMTGE